MMRGKWSFYAKPKTDKESKFANITVTYCPAKVKNIVMFNLG